MVGFYEDLHALAIKELQKRGYRWEIQGNLWKLQGFRGQDLLDWQLWESIENLDIQLYYARWLLARAKKRGETYKALKEIVKLYDEALSIIDPAHWRPPNKRFLGINPTVENVTEVLKRLIMIRRLIFVHRLSLGEIEKEKNYEVLPAFTFMLYTDVLDSIHGCKEWLKEVSRNAGEIPR